MKLKQNNFLSIALKCSSAQWINLFWVSLSRMADIDLYLAEFIIIC